MTKNDIVREAMQKFDETTPKPQSSRRADMNAYYQRRAAFLRGVVETIKILKQ